MKVSFQNVGAIQQGQIDLAGLTVICGPNNVGKTHVSYCIYGLLRSIEKQATFLLDDERITCLIDDGSIGVDLAIIENSLKPTLANYAGEFSHQLAQFFSVETEHFADAKLDFDLNGAKVDWSLGNQETVNIGQWAKLVFEREPDSTDLMITYVFSGENHASSDVIKQSISEVIARLLLGDLIPSSFVVSSERTGVGLFQSDIQTIYGAGRITKTPKNLYAQPIVDNVHSVRQAKQLLNTQSFISQESHKYQSILSMLEDLLGGRFGYERNQLVYKPKTGTEIPVPISITSSAVKSLFLIDLYIKHIAIPNGLLIIDEPELNLHPDNQRKMAGLLVGLVNAGINVLITTHSDYLIREINNRIMLSQDFGARASIMKKSGVTEVGVLKHQQVSAYNINPTNHHIDPVEVDQYGINMEIFDQLIAQSNILADEIYYGLEGESQ